MKKLLKLGNSIYFSLMVFWLYFSIYFIFQYLNIDYSNLNRSVAKFLVILFFSSILSFHYRKSFLRLLNYILQIILKKKYLLVIGMLTFQIIITLSSLSLASADTTIVFNIATNVSFAQTTDYISQNPNNFLLVLWFKLNYIFAGNNLLFILALWNIIFIDSSIAIIYKINKMVIGAKIANLSFLIMSLILGFSPQYIYTYSDTITLFLLTLFIYSFCKLILDKTSIRYSLCSGIFLGFATGFRPTVLIFLISFAIVIIFIFLRGNIQKYLKSYLRSILVFSAAFAMTMLLTSSILNYQSVVKYEANKSRTMLYYVNLGLTYSGNIHSELSEEILNSEGKDRNRIAINEIKSRLKNYNFETFIGHLFYKYYWMTGEGMLGWFQERVFSESNRPDISWLKNIQDTKIAKLIRTYVYVEGENYFYYALFIQILWVIMVIGLIFYSKLFVTNNYYLLWMQISIFGALMFLFIFEAGRTRYLIQFLPAIITISATGWSSIIDYFKTKHQKSNIK